MLDNALTIAQGSQTRTFNYDGMGRFTSETQPENGTTNYQYNSFDEFSQRTDNRGVITTYSYDTVNRLHQVSYNVGTTGVPATPTVTYTYGTTPSQYNNGRLITMADGTGSSAYTYDVMGRETQESHTVGGTAYPVSYQYNFAGEVTSMTYPSNRDVSPTYDAIGRLSSVADASATYLSGIAYNVGFQATGFTLGNGVAASMGYTPDRMALQSAAYTNSGTSLFGQAYTYGSGGANNGEMTAITDSVDTGRNMTYTYDSLDRLSNAKSSGSTNYPAWGLSFTYDRYGNRTAQGISSGCTGLTCPTSSVTVSATTNQLTGSPYAYDANGSMTNDSVNTMTYDAENRVLSAADGSGTATYAYDGLGRRVQKTFSGTTTTYIFAGKDVLSEYANGTLTNEYIRAGRNLVAEYNSGTLTYHGRDRLSVRINMNTSGTVTGQQGHFPFGENWYMTNSTTKWHFTAYERDAESGNDHATFRYHVNRVGRFSSTDPARGGPLPQRLNLYAYSTNDPIDHFDPAGLDPGPVLPPGLCDPSDPDTWDGCMTCDSKFFLDDPEPLCPAGDPGGPACADGQNCNDPEPPEPPPSPQPECFCQLKNRTVNYWFAHLLHAQHDFWYVQDNTGTQYFLEAGPSNPRGSGFLIANRIPLPGGPGDANAHAGFTAGPSPSVCNSTSLMEVATLAFPPVNVYRPITGPNSNSFAHYIGQVGGFKPSPPFWSPGWNTPVIGIVVF